LTQINRCHEFKQKSAQNIGAGAYEMTNDAEQLIRSFRFDFNQWDFADFRINIPANSFGSDAINPHTQYSNPLAILQTEDGRAVGSSFTLGEGNQMVCEAAEYLVKQLHGVEISQLIDSSVGFHETLVNPLQLRWLSPNAGIPMLAGGLVINTLLDHFAKLHRLPAWEFLALLPTDTLMSLFPKRHLLSKYNDSNIKTLLDLGLNNVEQRCELLKRDGLPVYFTTWIGHSAQLIAEQINFQYRSNGIKTFKMKIGSDLNSDIEKIKAVKALVSEDTVLAVDANQTLSFEQAKTWMAELSHQEVRWLEEPFAPDNIALFRELGHFRNKGKWYTEIATGENCPNHYVAAELMESGVNRFQPDPCRMLGLIDAIFVCCLAKINNCPITPHAGGSSLDELSPHIQLFNLARICIDTNPNQSLTENVGFCSHHFASPIMVKKGKLETPKLPGLLGDVSVATKEVLKSYKEGVSWLEHSY